MAFVPFLLEGLELAGEALFAYEAGEAATAVAVGAAEAEAAGYGVAAAETSAVAASDAFAVTEGLGGEAVNVAAEAADFAELEYGPQDLLEYEDQYFRLPTEEPWIEEGYPVEGGRPFDPTYVGPAGPEYMLIPSEEEAVGGVPYAVASAWTYLANDPMLRTAITVGGGKAALVAGFWYILDPLTGAPVYAIAGDDPRVDSIMQALGYTQNARDYGRVMREWFLKLFGYNVPSSPAGPSTSAVLEGAPRRKPLRPQSSISPNPLFPENSTMSYDRRPKKRPRSDSGVVMVPTAGASGYVPRPIVRMKMQRRPKRVLTLQRTLTRFIPITMSCDVSNNISYGVNGKYGAAVTGSYAASDGYQWGSNAFGFISRLADFNEYTDIKNSFDQYRIKSVSFTFIPSRDDAQVNSGQKLPVLICCEDRDDILLTAATPEKLSAKQGMKFFRLENPFTVKTRPTAWSSESSSAPKTKILGGWLPCVNDTVMHYGLKLAPISTTLSTSSTYEFTLMVKASVEAKHMD